VVIQNRGTAEYSFMEKKEGKIPRWDATITVSRVWEKAQNKFSKFFELINNSFYLIFIIEMLNVNKMDRILSLNRIDRIEQD